MSWQEIITKGEKGKQIHICGLLYYLGGPCKFMAKNIFPLKETGDAVNPHYISVGIQIDSTGEGS